MRLLRDVGRAWAKGLRVDFRAKEPTSRIIGSRTSSTSEQPPRGAPQRPGLVFEPDDLALAPSTLR